MFSILIQRNATFKNCALKVCDKILKDMRLAGLTVEFQALGINLNQLFLIIELFITDGSPMINLTDLL